jgi:ABC-type Mn2+/Zn2+ transport system ATPase subunit
MIDPVFLKRVVLRNYKSIAVCSVKLGPLTFLVGPNGAGKSNFTVDVHQLKGILPAPAAPISLEDMEDAIRHRAGR